MNGIAPNTPPTNYARGAGGGSLRIRNKKRDDALRRKIEQEISKRPGKKDTKRPGTSTSGSYSTPRKFKLANTVASLRPSAPITIPSTCRIIQAAQLMAAKRTDAVLVVNPESGSLVGILTDKDIAYRVVAEGLDVRSTMVESVMTKNPFSVEDKSDRNAALDFMVQRKFRHLPVLTEVEQDEEEMEDDENGESSPRQRIVGMLDITKCVFERLDDLEKKVNEDENIIAAMETLERRGAVESEKVDAVRGVHRCPDVGGVLANINMDRNACPEVGVRQSVKEAASIMKSQHVTAVLVIDDEDRVAGIFTTKDIVLRVLAASLDPSTTSLIRVMTPHPDSIDSKTSILEALRKLRDGHYLHLPVVDESSPVGLVDVMTLTMTMLDYLVEKSKAAMGIGEKGPVWNTFWKSDLNPANPEEDNQSEHNSQASGRNPSTIASSTRQQVAAGGLVEAAPSEDFGNSSFLATSSVITSPTTFAFKVRDITSSSEGKVYRFSSDTSSLENLIAEIATRTSKSSSEILSTKLTYLDEDKDTICLEKDEDLQEAVSLARRFQWNRLVLFLGIPPQDVLERDRREEQEPTPRPPATPAPSLALEASRAENKDVSGVDLMNLPLAIQVGISAGIVVITSFVLLKLFKSS